MYDPDVLSSSYPGIPTNSTWQDVEDLSDGSAFGEAVEDYLGYPPSMAESFIKSSYGKRTARGLEYKIENGKVTVRISMSDSSGKMGKGKGAIPIEMTN
jgi:hypothetical protein